MSLFLLSGLLYSLALPAQEGKIDWSVPVRLPQGLAGVLAGVDHGVMLVGGGCNFPDSMPWAGGKKRYYHAVYVVERRGGHWGCLEAFSLPENTAYGASVSTPQGVIYIGGENEDGVSARVYCLQWDSVARKVRVRRLADLPVAVSNAAASVMGQTVYVAGGETRTGVSSGLYALDLGVDGARWELVSELPKPLSHAVLVASGRGLWLAGGRKRNPGGLSDLSDAVYRYEPGVRRWNECRHLPYAWSAGAGVLLDENSLLLIGGDRGEVFHRVEELIGEIARTSDAAERQELVLQKARVQSSHPGFSQQLLLYDMRRDVWRVYEELGFPAPATTVAVRWNDDIVIPGGEIKAGVRTPQILIGAINR
ncbi:MAG TPA: hypothetical protein VGM31_05260 [Puia sp.]